MLQSINGVHWSGKAATTVSLPPKLAVPSEQGGSMKRGGD